MSKDAPMSMPPPQRDGRALPEQGPGDPPAPRASQGSRGSNQAGVRLYNERLILSLIRRHASLPKVEIARLTGLSAQATTVIVNRLEADGLLLKGAPQRGRVGQPTVPFTLNPEGAFSFGLKIGRKSSDLVLIDFCARIRGKISHAHNYPTPAVVTGFARDGVASMMAALAPSQIARIAGLGIAAPFQLWNWVSEVGAPRAIMEQWRDLDIQAKIAPLVPMPVYLCNDATSACAAELTFGKGWHNRDFLYIFIGTFVGGGLVIGGHLFLGRTGNAGAIGSMPMARPQTNGARQQLIRSASIFVLEQKMLAMGRDPAQLWRKSEPWDEANVALDEWIADAASDLAQAIVSANAIVDLEAAVIDAALPAEILARLVAATAAAMAQLDQQGLTPVSLRAGTIGPDARAIGGAALAFLANFAQDREVLFKETPQLQGDIHAEGH